MMNFIMQIKGYDKTITLRYVTNVAFFCETPNSVLPAEVQIEYVENNEQRACRYMMKDLQWFTTTEV